MPPPIAFLALGAVLATMLTAFAWVRVRASRSPARSIAEFKRTMRALKGR